LTVGAAHTHPHHGRFAPRRRPHRDAGARAGSRRRAHRAWPTADGGSARRELEGNRRRRRGVLRDPLYVTFTFQKTGAVNLRMPWTSLRNAVGWNHSPHGTYVTSSRATLWISSASCLRLA